MTHRGVALGDSWISPVDYVLAWTPFLKAWSLLEDVALANVSQVALRTQQAVGNGNLTGATALWALLEETISNATDNVVCSCTIITEHSALGVTQGLAGAHTPWVALPARVQRAVRHN